MEELIKRYKQLDTTCVSDALDRLGIAGGLLGIKAMIHGTPICGRAFTVHYVPCGLEKGTVGDFLDDVKPGEVVVIDNGGRDYCTVWGDLMTVCAKQKGIEGTLIDGVCRDVPEIRRVEYPLYTKGHYMVTGKDRVEVDAINIPVSISGVQVKAGDIILADDSGAVVIPGEMAEKVLEAAEEIAESERKIMEAVSAGLSLRESREKVHYHKLQTKKRYEAGEENVSDR